MIDFVYSTCGREQPTVSGTVLGAQVLGIRSNGGPSSSRNQLSRYKDSEYMCYNIAEGWRSSNNVLTAHFTNSCHVVLPRG